MIILPVSTPAAAIDQNSVNQSQQTQAQAVEHSRKASDTVRISAEAQQLADNSVSSNQSRSGDDPTRVMAAEAAKVLRESPQPAANSEPASIEVNTAPLAPHRAADNEAAEKVADNEIIEQQRPTNALTGKQETTKIDVVA